MAFSDHCMVILDIEHTNKKHEQQSEIWARNWHGYSKEKLVEKLVNVDWDCNIERAQDYYNWIENKLLEIVDELAPLTKRKCVHISSYSEKSCKSLINKHRRLVKKWKQKQLPAHKHEANILKKQIRDEVYKNTKMKIRKHIRPGNAKTLWDAVRIAKDEDTSSIPSKMNWNGREIDKDKIAEKFAEHFRNKVENTIKETSLSSTVYNGKRLFTCDSKFFMTKTNVLKTLKGLTIKNCEGYDRLPLRIFNEGAEVLLDTLTVLYTKIYEEKKVPMQWKVARVIPLHKKGDKALIENYRPISNLCAMSKIYEKLILSRLWEIAEEKKVDLTGETQHGFKKARSTVTAALTLQSLIARSLDENMYVAVASLDLSAAFDVVDRNLLFERLEIMGLPEDIRCMIKDWLTDRQSYIDVRGESTYMENSKHGTVQGSVLGPVLFSLFIRPVYKIENLTTYADDNYVMRTGHELKDVLQRTQQAIENVSSWLKKSGLKVNEDKTELCVFHRRNKIRENIVLGKNIINSKDSINILGICFDENLKWNMHVNKAIKESNQVLHGIKVIKNYFNLAERKDLITSLFFSKIYYGAEIWHLPDLSGPLKKAIKKSSANALKICITDFNQFTTHTEIHLKAERSPPQNLCLYKHALLLHKLVNTCIPENEHLHMNFQLLDNIGQK
jgi:hypothetical protein